MNLRSSLGVIAIGLLIWGCDSDPQKVAPEARGQRGESCQARNDCASGLACISGVCSRNDFEVNVSARQCDLVQCQAQADCCGNRPTEAPADCARRTAVCSTPTLPGCTQTACTSDAMCGTGTCRPGFCSQNSSITCGSTAECADTCVDNFCTITAASCLTSADCLGFPGTCSIRTCNCANPDYNPLDPVCSNPDCVDLCTLVCEDERCVQDTSCQTDADCFALGGSICDGGQCVECVSNADCDVAEGEGCVNGFCETPCTQNEECPLFHQCDGGECVERGCTTDRECILAASNLQSSDDARLSKCLPSEINPDLNVCKVPCENDGACGSEFEVCDEGFCRFVGCESDEECRAYLGLENEEVTDVRPFISKAVCRE